ncbi:hypothetical protein OPIT5_02140 [Opitutaceae bacterium TAV5]|nr:hypothetical protein OPIT5_02140 [Opitutaceae bacterium TAV5]
MSTRAKQPRLARKAAPRDEVHIPLSEFIDEGLKIRHRFMAEPVFAKTGVGFMRSAGVAEISAAKKTSRRISRSKG